MSQTQLHDWRAPLSARALALAFLSTGTAPLRAAALARRAAIFGVDAAAMRMALGRLCREGVTMQVERGTYEIGGAGAAVNRLARGWREAETRVRAWDGRWIVVLTDQLGRTDRKRLRARELALRLTGLARAPDGAWLRPDNLALDLPALAARLRSLGLDAGATVLDGARMLAPADAAARTLWPAAEIMEGYRFWIAEMDASERRVAAMALPDAAAETLLLGQSVIRAINRDPMLPDAMTDAALRTRMIDRMRRYDAVGKAFWAQVT